MDEVRRTVLVMPDIGGRCGIKEADEWQAFVSTGHFCRHVIICADPINRNDGTIGLHLSGGCEGAGHRFGTGTCG